MGGPAATAATALAAAPSSARVPASAPRTVRLRTTRPTAARRATTAAPTARASAAASTASGRSLSTLSPSSTTTTPRRATTTSGRDAEDDVIATRRTGCVRRVALETCPSVVSSVVGAPRSARPNAKRFLHRGPNLLGDLTHVIRHLVARPAPHSPTTPQPHAPAAPGGAGKSHA